MYFLYYFNGYIHINNQCGKCRCRNQVKSPSSQRKNPKLHKMAFKSSVIRCCCFSSSPFTPTISFQFTHSLSSTLPHPRLTRSPFGSFITGLLPLSGDDHLSSTSSHNRLVNALIAFSLCVGYTGRGSIIS